MKNVKEHFIRALTTSQGEEENVLHPADVMEQNHNQVGGEGEEEEEPRGENGLGQVQQPRSLKRQLIDVKMEPSGLR